MIRILFLCLISTKHSLAQAVSWTVGTSVPRFNEDLKLVCTVSAGCCTSSDRIWADSNGNQILNNGNSAPPNKYEEDWDGGNTGFNLTIKNLQLLDVGVDYDCQYSLGNDKHTLTQDATWEYPPSENCPITWSEGYLKGELIIARSAPSPTFLASFRGINVTSDLTIKEKTNFDTWFYSMKVEIKKIISCSKGDRFTLSVITGTTTTKICDAEIECGLCPGCSGRCFAWGVLGMVIAGLLWIGVGCLYCAYMNKENGKVLKAVSISGLVFLAIDFCTAIPIGLVGCFCYDFNDTLNDIEYHKDPLFTLIAISAIFAIFIGLLLWCKDHKIDEYHAWIFFGVITYGIGLLICKYSDVFIEKINAIIGGTARLLCPYKADSGQITWIKLNGNLRETYSDGTAISQDLPHNLRDRLNVEGRDLCISNVQESDAGIYECVFTPKPDKVPLGSKLKLIVSAGKEKKPSPV